MITEWVKTDGLKGVPKALPLVLTLTANRPQLMSPKMSSQIGPEAAARTGSESALCASRPAR